MEFKALFIITTPRRYDRRLAHLAVYESPSHAQRHWGIIAIAQIILKFRSPRLLLQDYRVAEIAANNRK